MDTPSIAGVRPPVKTKLFQHQQEAFEFGLANPNVALLMEQGCGKTLTTLAIAGERYLRGEVKKLLIIAPTSVVPVWQKEFTQHADYAYEALTLSGTGVRRKKMFQEWKPSGISLKIVVTNYESTWRMDDMLRKWKPDMVVLDESQRIKNHVAKQSKELHKIGRVAKYRMILTGTPVSNTPLEFFSQYKFLDPEIFGNNFAKFRIRYALMGGHMGRQVVSYINLDELTQKVHSIAYRVTKADALDLPDTVDQTLYCALEPSARKAYREIAKESYTELLGESKDGEVSAHSVLTKLLRLSQLTGGILKDDDGDEWEISTAKLKALGETIDDLRAAGKKVVIFARFRSEIRSIQELLKRKKIQHVSITGGTTNRGEIVERFQNDPDCLAFVGQLQTVREGLTLTAADTAIFYSFDYSYADYSQAKARIHRIGQRNKCTYIHLICPDTVDETVMSALQEKKSMADLVVDNWKSLFKK